MNNKLLICAKCKTQIKDRPKRSFLGFQLFTCPNCNEKIEYPLTHTYRAIYWLIAIIFILYSISAILQGAIPMPGLLGIAAVVGLVKDYSLKNKIRVRNIK